MNTEYTVNVKIGSLYHMLCGNYVMPKTVSVESSGDEPGGITFSTNNVEDIEHVARCLYQHLPMLIFTMTIQKPSPTVAAVLAELGVLEAAGECRYVCADLDTIIVKTYSISALKRFASKLN